MTIDPNIILGLLSLAATLGSSVAIILMAKQTFDRVLEQLDQQNNRMNDHADRLARLETRAGANQ